MIELVAATGSTNADLVRRVHAGEMPGDFDWLIADRQTAGHGRQGRVWNDAVGNFMGSTTVRLRGGDRPPQTLSLVAGIATYAAIELVASGIAGLALKWPNDVLIGRAKLAGVLLERSGNTVVVGVGVNLAYAPDIPGRKVACLADQGFKITRDAFAESIDGCWQQLLQRWRNGDWDQLRSEWLIRAHPVGTNLMVHGPGGESLRGTFVGVDGDGALQLQLPSGTRQTIHAGEVDLDHRC